MRKNIVTGLIRCTALSGLLCLLSLVPACTTEKGDTESTSGAATNANTMGTTGEATESGSGTGTTAPTTGDACEDPTGSDPNSVMEDFGAPCTDDADCKPILGDDGVCLKDILGIYGLPCGYCSKLCMLPDNQTAYVPDDATCGMGVTCIGAMGYFEGCVRECTDNSQCPRDGYECRVMPQIGQADDPKFCLMTDDNML